MGSGGGVFSFGWTVFLDRVMRGEQRQVSVSLEGYKIGKGQKGRERVFSSPHTLFASRHSLFRAGISWFWGFRWNFGYFFLLFLHELDREDRLGCGP